MGQIVSGKGFRVVIEGVVPPELQGEENVILWVTSSLSFSAQLAGHMRAIHVELTKDAVPGGPRIMT